MNKSGLIEILDYEDNYLSKEDLDNSINLILDFISSTLSNGGRVELRDFGSFSIRRREERIARNPKTGTSIKVNEKFHPYFRASKSLKESLKN